MTATDLRTVPFASGAEFRDAIYEDVMNGYQPYEDEFEWYGDADDPDATEHEFHLDNGVVESDCLFCEIGAGRPKGREPLPPRQEETLL